MPTIESTIEHCIDQYNLPEVFNEIWVAEDATGIIWTFDNIYKLVYKYDTGVYFYKLFRS